MRSTPSHCAAGRRGSCDRWHFPPFQRQPPPGRLKATDNVDYRHHMHLSVAYVLHDVGMRTASTSLCCVAAFREKLGAGSSSARSSLKGFAEAEKTTGSMLVSFEVLAAHLVSSGNAVSTSSTSLSACHCRFIGPLLRSPRRPFTDGSSAFFPRQLQVRFCFPLHRLPCGVASAGFHRQDDGGHGVRLGQFASVKAG